MNHHRSLRFRGLLVPVLATGSLALSAYGCSGTAAPTAPGEEHVGSAGQALDEAQCAYFDVNGKDQICHHTGSGSHPYTIIKTSEQGCINGHSGHPLDYIAVGDPTCQGGGCLPVSAPCDATLPCCDGLTCQAGTCVQPAAVCPCPVDPGWIVDVCAKDYSFGPLLIEISDASDFNYFEVQESTSSCYSSAGGNTSVSGLSPAEIQACLVTLQALDTANFCGSCDALCGAGNTCNYNPDGQNGGNQCD